MRRLLYALLIIGILSGIAIAGTMPSLPMYGTSYDGLPYVQFELDGQTCEEGRLVWNSDDKTMTVCTENADVSLQVGQESYIRGTNKTGSTLNNGQVVYINGAQGNRPTFALANATSALSDAMVGMITANIPDNGTGYATTHGLVRGLNTNSFEAGDTIYIDTTPGGITNTAPVTPNHLVTIGRVVTKNAEDGVVLVLIEVNGEINDLHDVLETSPQAGDTLVYNGTYWANEPHTSGQVYYPKGASTLDFSTDTDFINVTGLTADATTTFNMIANATNGSLEVVTTDDYMCSFTQSHASASAATYSHTLGKNGTPVEGACASVRIIGTPTAIGGVPFNCQLALESGDVVTGMVNSVDAETIQYSTVNLNCIRH